MKKHLIFIGSPRKQGESYAMLELLVKHLEGEVKIIDAYKSNYEACIDCRYCWYKQGCSINDGIDEVYQALNEADSIVFISPVYFHSITGRLKIIIDRFQTYWAQCKRHDQYIKPNKQGAFLLCGGAPLFPNQYLGSELVLKGVLHDFKTINNTGIYLSNTDVKSLEQQEDVQKQIINLALALNQ